MNPAICYGDYLICNGLLSTCVVTGVQYRVEPREIKARLDSPIVMAVMEMGYPRDLIRRAIERRLTSTGLFSFFCWFFYSSRATFLT